jgi:hypothetical protein
MIRYAGSGELSGCLVHVVRMCVFVSMAHVALLVDMLHLLL